jgi:hypothetical protein
MVDMIYFPLAGLRDDLTRLPGHRVRRFFLLRGGRQGRLHFFNGTPTAIVLDLDRDEPDVLNWIGLPVLGDGEAAWFDLAARTVQPEKEGGRPEKRQIPHLTRSRIVYLFPTGSINHTA